MRATAEAELVLAQRKYSLHRMSEGQCVSRSFRGVEGSSRYDVKGDILHRCACGNACLSSTM